MTKTRNPEYQESMALQDAKQKVISNIHLDSLSYQRLTHFSKNINLQTKRR